MKKVRQPRKGQTVTATITDISQPSGERTVTGVVIEVLSAQFVVQAPDEKGAIYPGQAGYRFVMNKDEWKVVA